MSQSDIFPGRPEIPEIFRTADAAEVLRTNDFQQQTEKLRKGKPIRLPKLWSDHFQSVAEFHIHLWRNGGRYTSGLMEMIRRRYGLPTIRGGK